MPGKEDSGAPPQADDSVFLLLVRGPSDRVPTVEEPEAFHCVSRSEDLLVVGQTPLPDSPTWVSDFEVEDTGKDGGPLSLLILRNQPIYLAHSQTSPRLVPRCVP